MKPQMFLFSSLITLLTATALLPLLLIFRFEQGSVESLNLPQLSPSAITGTMAALAFNNLPDNRYSSGYRWQALPAIAPYPSDNPPSPEKAALGQKLFNDQRLSADGTISCATCHNLKLKAGADSREIAQGIYGQLGLRNTPTVWNTAFQKRLFWDGRASSLEQQALQPLLNPLEMGMVSEQAILDRLESRADYRQEFSRVFGAGAITIDKLARALASYQRTLITNDSPYDDFVRGDSSALSDQQLNGMVLFERVGCVLCHSGPNFSVASVYTDGQSLRLFPANPVQLTHFPELTDIDGKEPGVWRVPSLRNVALTGPWLHNGSVDNLEDVVRIMASSQLGMGVDRQVFLSNNELRVIENPMLTDREVEDIVTFLHALSSKRLAASAEGQKGIQNNTGASDYHVSSHTFSEQ